MNVFGRAVEAGTERWLCFAFGCGDDAEHFRFLQRINDSPRIPLVEHSMVNQKVFFASAILSMRTARQSNRRGLQIRSPRAARLGEP